MLPLYSDSSATSQHRFPTSDKPFALQEECAPEHDGVAPAHAGPYDATRRNGCYHNGDVAWKQAAWASSSPSDDARIVQLMQQQQSRKPHAGAGGAHHPNGRPLGDARVSAVNRPSHEGVHSSNGLAASAPVMMMSTQQQPVPQYPRRTSLQLPAPAPHPGAPHFQRENVVLGDYGNNGGAMPELPDAHSFPPYTMLNGTTPGRAPVFPSPQPLGVNMSMVPPGHADSSQAPHSFSMPGGGKFMAPMRQQAVLSWPGQWPFGSRQTPPPECIRHLETLEAAIQGSTPGTGEIEKLVQSAWIRPRLPGLTAMMGRLTRRGLWRHSLDVFKLCPVLGLTWDTKIFNAALSASGQGEQWHSLMCILDFMVAQNASFDAGTCRAAFGALRAKHNWPDLIKVAMFLRQHQVSRSLYLSELATVILELSVVEKWLLAESLLLHVLSDVLCVRALPEVDPKAEQSLTSLEQHALHELRGALRIVRHSRSGRSEGESLKGDKTPSLDAASTLDDSSSQTAPFSSSETGAEQNVAANGLGKMMNAPGKPAAMTQPHQSAIASLLQGIASLQVSNEGMMMQPSYVQPQKLPLDVPPIELQRCIDAMRWVYWHSNQEYRLDSILQHHR